VADDEAISLEVLMKSEIDVLFTKEQIQKRVEEMARQIEDDYSGRELIVVGVLKGAFIFMSDLVRHIKVPLACDFLRVTSYEHDKNTGVVRMEFDTTQPVAGKDVLLVEDIVDTGRTLRHIIKHMETKDPRSIKVASLLYKETGAGVKKLVNYIGFETPNKYVIGYGLDSEGIYRSLPYIGAFK
jgi:hypoxanthine phosphoribosyltransferase